MPKQQYYGDKYNQGDFNWTTKFGKKKPKTEGEKIDTGTYTEEGPIDTGDLGPDGSRLMIKGMPPAIDPEEHKRLQKQKKIRNIADEGATEGERAAGRRKLKDQTDLPNFLQSAEMDEVYSRDSELYGEFDDLVEAAKNATGREKKALLQRAGRVREQIETGKDPMTIGELPGAAWGVAQSYGQSIMEDPAAMSEHTLDMFADFQAASKGYQAGSKFGPKGAIVGTIGGVALRRGGKELIERTLANIGKFTRKISHRDGGILVYEAVGGGQRFKTKEEVISNVFQSRKIDSTSGGAKSKGFADPTGQSSSKFYNPEFGDVLANADPKNVELLKKIGLTDNESKFVLDNYYKIDRDTAAAIENLGSSVEEFEKTREAALPFFLKAWNNVKRKRTPQLDHTTQLKAALPFFNNARVKEFPEIARIIVEEGIFSLGHSKKNLTMLDADVHQIKTNFWTRTVGPNGQKFFEGRDISTPEKLRAAAKEYAKLIKQSNNIVDNAIQQYRLMNQKDISAAELDEFVNRLGGGRINQKNMVKQVKGILTEMEEDGFIQTPKSTTKIEKTSIKQEKKGLKAADKRKETLAKDDISVERRMEEIQNYISTREKTFKGQYPLGLKDEQLHFDAETIVKDMKKNRALRENIQGTIFDQQNEAAQIEAMKKILWERTGRSRNK